MSLNFDNIDSVDFDFGSQFEVLTKNKAYKSQALNEVTLSTYKGSKGGVLASLTIPYHIANENGIAVGNKTTIHYLNDMVAFSLNNEGIHNFAKVPSNTSQNVKITFGAEMIGDGIKKKTVQFKIVKNHLVIQYK